VRSGPILRWFTRLRRGYTAVAIFCLNALVVFAALNAIVWLFHPAPARGPAGEPWPGLRQNVESHIYPDLDADDAGALARETIPRFRYEPYTDIRERPLAGRFVNIDEAGFRRTREQGPWPPEAKSYNLFLFGGSTTFGYGLNDEETIASFLQPMLPPVDGRPVRVYNFGRCGYYSTQERILFELLMSGGYVPDAAVFIDGLNEFGAPDDRPFVADSLEPALADQPLALAELVDLFPITTTVRHIGRVLRGAKPPDVYENPARADRVIVRWIRSMRLLEGMGDALGISAVFVWQPIAAYEFPAGTSSPWHSTGVNGWAGYAYPRMRARLATSPLGPRLLWCADVARDAPGTFYIDAVHYGPPLAERVARCIADGLKERDLLQAAARAR
jgi:hypothetical protein